MRAGFTGVVPSDEVARAEAAFSACQGTGIQQAVTGAVNLAVHQPSLVFPVASLDTCQSMGYAADGAPHKPLDLCLQVHAAILFKVSTFQAESIAFV